MSASRVDSILSLPPAFGQKRPFTLKSEAHERSLSLTGLHKCEKATLRPSRKVCSCCLVAVVVVRFMVAMATF